MNDLTAARPAMIRALSERIVEAQRPIRILDAIKWNEAVKTEFFKKKCQVLPHVDREMYQAMALAYHPEDKTQEFYAIERDISKELGQFSHVGNLMRRMCREYRTVIQLVKSRGTPQFSMISQELFGASDDAFYAGSPTLNDLAGLVTATFEKRAQVQEQSHWAQSHHDKADNAIVYSSEEAVSLLNQRLNLYFADEVGVTRVKVSDDIVADASAGAETIRLRSNAWFTEQQLKVLEVHEGWVHLGTTMNGAKQPYCTFLGKGAPSSTLTQEGLAIIMEIFTFSSYPGRVQRLADRIRAIHLAEQGADFLDIFKFYQESSHSEEEAYARTVRVFRGSLPSMGPFTKDLAYAKGFVLIYNFIRLAIQQGLESYIPLLFLGKTTLEDIHVLNDLMKEGIVLPPLYIPEQFKDMAALSAWMSFSLFLNQLSLSQIAKDYKSILSL